MDTLGLVVGNLCSLLAMIADSISASRKTVKSMLLFQNISQLIYCIGAIVLKGYSGAVQNAVSILRNMTAVGKKPTKAVEWTLIGLGVVLGLICNNRGFIGLLPVVANLEYSLAVFRFRDNERALKKAFLVSVFLFTIFCGFILNFVGVIANVVLFIMTILFLVRQKPEQA